MKSLSTTTVLSLLALSPIVGAQVSQETYFKASNPDDGDRFGHSVAVHGDTLVVGADREHSVSTGVNGDQNSNGFPFAGAAYVFRRSGTTWVQEAYLKASNANSGDRFGTSVGVFGDTVVIGAPGETSNTTVINGDQNINITTGAGAAYVFTRSGSTWSQEAYLKPFNFGLNHFFGSAVAIDGDSIVVGTPGERGAVTGVNGDPNAGFKARAGAAYVFVRSGTTWTQEAYVKASTTDIEDFFGTSVAIDGDTMLIGAPEEDSSAAGVGGDQADDSQTDAGAAYVFVRSGTTWTQEAYLKSVVPQPTPFFKTMFGQSVDLSGDTAVIGGRDQAETFERTGTTWTPATVLGLSNTAILPGSFGEPVSIDGDILAVGAVTDSSSASGINGQICNAESFGSGAVLLYRRTGTTWGPETYIKASTPGGLDNFGNSLALDQDNLAVGASREASDGVGVDGTESGASMIPGQGAAYNFDLASSTLNPDQPACVLYVSACAGDGGDQMGCTDCPCNNNGAASDAGCLNSAGTSATLIPSGNPIVDDGTLRFEASGLPPSITAVLISGASLAPANPQNPCFGLDSGVTAMQLDGLRCAVMSGERHGARQSDASGQVGFSNNGWGGPDPFFNFGAFVVGVERHFQLFYRDDDAQVCMTGQNTTQAVTTSFLP